MKNLNIVMKLTLLTCALFLQVVKANTSYFSDIIHLLYNTTDKPITFDQIISIDQSSRSTSVTNNVTVIPPRSFVAMPLEFAGLAYGASGFHYRVRGLVWSSSFGDFETFLRGHQWVLRSIGVAGSTDVISAWRVGKADKISIFNKTLSGDVGILATDAAKKPQQAYPLRLEKGIGALHRLLGMGLKDISNIKPEVDRLMQGVETPEEKGAKRIANLNVSLAAAVTGTKDDPNLVADLLRQGAVVSSLGCVPMETITKGHVNILKLLIEKGACVHDWMLNEVKNRRALRPQTNAEEIIKLLEQAIKKQKK